MDMWRSRSALSLSQFTSERRHRKTRVWFGPVSGVIGGSLAWSAQSNLLIRINERSTLKNVKSVIWPIHLYGGK